MCGFMWNTRPTVSLLGGTLSGCFACLGAWVWGVTESRSRRVRLLHLVGFVRRPIRNILCRCSCAPSKDKMRYQLDCHGCFSPAPRRGLCQIPNLSCHAPGGKVAFINRHVRQPPPASLSSSVFCCARV